MSENYSTPSKEESQEAQKAVESNNFHPNEFLSDRKVEKTYLGLSTKSRYCFINVLAILVLNVTIAAFGQDYISLSIFLLMDPDYFNVSEKEIGRVANDILFYVIPFQLLFLLFAGFFYDIFGRRNTLIVYILVASLSAFLTPLSAPSLYPWYFIVRIIGGCAIFGIMGHPLIIDYIKKSSRGKAYAIQTFGQLVGSYIGIGILFNATKMISIDLAYYILGIFAVVVAIVLFFMIREPVIKVRAINRLETETNLDKGKRLLGLTVIAMKTNPALPLCLLAALISRMQLSIVLSFQILWVTGFIKPYGTIEDEDEAKSVYVYLNIIGGFLTLFTFYFMGKSTDRFSPKILTPISFVARACCLLSIMLISSPQSFLSYIIWSLLTMVALFQSVVIDGYYAKLLPKDVRGVLLAFMVFTSLIGKAFIIKVGGVLFDRKGRNAPFVLIALFDIVFSVIITVLISLGYYGNIPESESDGEKMDLVKEDIGQKGQLEFDDSI